MSLCLTLYWLQLLTFRTDCSKAIDISPGHGTTVPKHVDSLLNLRNSYVSEGLAEAQFYANLNSGFIWSPTQVQGPPANRAISKC